MKFILFCVTLELSDNLTEMRLKTYRENLNSSSMQVFTDHEHGTRDGYHSLHGRRLELN